MNKKDEKKLVQVNARFFQNDVREIHRIADERCTPWQVELRLLVRRALRGDRREVVVLKEKPE